MTQNPERDYGFFAIVFLVIAVVVWLLLTPFVPAVARLTIDRFHLRGDSFVRWAAQFPIPAMYNFANREITSNQPIDEFAMDDPVGVTRYANHFPARLITFSDGRARVLEHGTDAWVTIETSYRGQTVRSAFHAKSLDGPSDDPAMNVVHYRLIRLPDPERRR